MSARLKVLNQGSQLRKPRLAERTGSQSQVHRARKLFPPLTWHLVTPARRSWKIFCKWNCHCSCFYSLGCTSLLYHCCWEYFFSSRVHILVPRVCLDSLLLSRTFRRLLLIFFFSHVHQGSVFFYHSCKGPQSFQKCIQLSSGNRNTQPPVPWELLLEGHLWLNEGLGRSVPPLVWIPGLLPLPSTHVPFVSLFRDNFPASVSSDLTTFFFMS